MDKTIPTPIPKKEKKFAGLGRRIVDIYRTYSYLSLAFTIPLVLMYLMYVARGIYPFGDSTVLVLDLNGQYVSFYEYLWDCIHNDASILYSFSRNLGGEFMGMFDYYVASPFALLIGLFPKAWIQESLLIVFLLKTGLSGFNMGFYLHKHSTTQNKLTIVTFSILYALSNYCIIQMHNSMWIDAVLWLPILVYAIEELIKRGRFRLYVFTLAIILFSNFYIGYMVCIFTVAYCFYYYFAHNQNNENNPTGEKNHFLRSVLRVACWSLLAAGIAAFIILSARYSLSMGKDEFSNPNWAVTQKFELMELFIKFLPSSYDTVRPEGLPFVYCGTLTLLLVPAFFISKKISNREKIAAAMLILFFVASFATSTLDLIWHGFQKPNWLNYRYSFMLCFFLIVLAFRAFENIQFTSRKALLGITAFLGFAILLIQELGDFITDSNEKLVIRPFATVWLALGCLIAYFIIICLWGRAKYVLKDKLSVILAFIVCAEVFASGLVDLEAFNKDVSFGSHTNGTWGYTKMIDTFRPITDVINENDDGFFRMEKSWLRKDNDNYALNMNGLSTSTSLLNRDTITFLQKMGYASYSHKSKYMGGTPVNDSLLGLKYIISDKDLSHYYGAPIYTPEDYDYDEDKVRKDEKFNVYLNPYALSLAFGASEKFADFDPEQYDNPFDRLNAMVAYLLGEEEPVSIFVPALQNGDPELTNVTSSNIAMHNKYEVDDKDSAGILDYSYTVPTNTELYFYFPSDYGREVKLKVNSSQKDNFGSGDGLRIISLGKYKSPEIDVQVRIENNDGKLYIKDSWESSVYYIDWGTFEHAMARLNKMQLDIDSGWSDDHLTGSLSTVSDNQFMFTSIAYDKGWQVTVDGKPVETFETANALLAFYVEDEGDHTVELRYMPTEYKLGITISILCTILFLILFLCYPLLCRAPGIQHIMGIQYPDLPMLEEEEIKPQPGDIGHREPEVPPVQEGIYPPTPQELEVLKQIREEEKRNSTPPPAPHNPPQQPKPQSNKSNQSKKKK